LEVKGINPFDFTNKVALVTGGSSGIGRATSLLFARHGAKVVIGDINSGGEETVETVTREEGEAIFVQTDVRQAEQVQNLVATAVKTFGGLHCAFNNAGVLPPMAPMADIEESTFDQTFAVDVKGVFLAMKYEIPQMLKTGGGAIVNNASIAGLIAERGISAYAAAKHAVIGLSKSAAIDYAGKGIRINALAPGLVETPMTKHWFDDPEMRGFFLANSPIGRFAQPEEVAAMVLFLCSDLASFAVGQTFAADGGYTAR
jgi:NAD(P)-dependent dehydrogenase (short-subunit alcohol dehydrogenase family)